LKNLHRILPLIDSLFFHPHFIISISILSDEYKENFVKNDKVLFSFVLIEKRGFFLPLVF
ncbi:MAG: hypothetical protein IJ136_01290, partial [Erysipelotrichaceae bacterium]|nr:hypothetical protein [Erysipelotrichaceae bacterium]